MVGEAIAERLGAPLDVLLVRKIGAPLQPELAIGAVVDAGRPVIVWNPDVMESFSLSASQRDELVEREWDEIIRRREMYGVQHEDLDLTSRVVIVADDGVATGATMRAALRGLRDAGVRRLVVAVPVGPLDTIRELDREVDGVACLETPEPFRAVGLAYRDFRQISDDEVIQALRRSGGERDPASTR